MQWHQVRADAGSHKSYRGRFVRAVAGPILIGSLSSVHSCICSGVKDCGQGLQGHIYGIEEPLGLWEGGAGSAGDVPGRGVSDRCCCHCGGTEALSCYS